MCVSHVHMCLRSLQKYPHVGNMCLSFMPYIPRPFLDQQLHDDRTFESISVMSLPQALLPGSQVTSVSVSDLNSVVLSQE